MQQRAKNSKSRKVKTPPAQRQTAKPTAVTAKVKPGLPQFEPGYDAHFRVVHDAINPVEQTTVSRSGEYRLRVPKLLDKTPDGREVRVLNIQCDPLVDGSPRNEAKLFFMRDSNGDRQLYGMSFFSETKWLPQPEGDVKGLRGPFNPGSQILSTDTFGVPMFAVVQLSFSGEEIVTTAAGDFKAAKFATVVNEPKRSGLIDWTMRKSYTLWYSTEVGLVKFRLQVSSDYANGTIDGSLLKVTLGSGRTYPR